MENRGKKTIRSNKTQIAYLCQYMAQHPNFAAGDYRTPLGASNNNAQWARLKEALDELGPHRSVEQWKVCWRDQKRKAREEGGAINKAHHTTGNFVPVPELSDNSALVLSAIGQEMAVGCGPEESPIGFIPETTAPLPAPAPSPFVSPSISGLAQSMEPSTSALGSMEPSTSALGSMPGCWVINMPEAMTSSTAEQPSTSGTGNHQPTPQRSHGPTRKRLRRVLPPDRFLQAQAETNALLKVEAMTSSTAEQPSTSGTGNHQPTPQRSHGPTRKRLRRVLPPDRFLQAQAETNALLKELVAEIRRGNVLKEEHLNFLKHREETSRPDAGSL